MTSNRIEQAAALWVVREESGALDPVAQRELDDWLQADPRHLGAFVRARAASLEITRTSALMAHRSGGDIVERSKRVDVKRRWLLAAGLSALGLISVGWWRLHFDVFKTDVGEVRRVLLSDNSSLLLNTASRVSVRMTATLREVQLEEGEALFEVAKDVDRPFIVRVGNISVRALGTAFSVRAFDSKTQVTVEEGTVELSAGDRAAQIPTRLSANETASETDRGIQVRAVSPEEIVRRLAWRDGRLAFAGESLARAVAEINRHNRRLIHIDDPALAARPVVGLFRTADPAGFARTIAAALGVESVESVDGIHLRPNPAR